MISVPAQEPAGRPWPTMSSLGGSRHEWPVTDTGRQISAACFPVSMADCKITGPRLYRNDAGLRSPRHSHRSILRGALARDLLGRIAA